MQSFLRLNKTLVSPLVAFCGGWAFTALLSQFHILSGQTAWSMVMVAVVVSVPHTQKKASPAIDDGQIHVSTN